MIRLRRKVIEILSQTRSGVRMYLLECGHTVSRRDYGKNKPHNSTYCDLCQIVLERLDRLGGNQTSFALRTNDEVMEFLAKEGRVKRIEEPADPTTQAQCPNAVVVSWKRYDYR